MNVDPYNKQLLDLIINNAPHPDGIRFFENQVGENTIHFMWCMNEFEPQLHTVCNTKSGDISEIWYDGNNVVSPVKWMREQPNGYSAEYYADCFEKQIDPNPTGHTFVDEIQEVWDLVTEAFWANPTEDTGNDTLTKEQSNGCSCNCRTKNIVVSFKDCDLAKASVLAHLRGITLNEYIVQTVTATQLTE